MRHDEAAWSSIEFNYSERCRSEHPERIAEDVQQRLAHPFPVQAYRAQLWAAALHDCYRQLDRIEAPTLVVHGADDRMIPVENGRMIAARIPGARLIELSDTGHLYPTEAPGVDEEISGFMRAHSAIELNSGQRFVILRSHERGHTAVAEACAAGRARGWHQGRVGRTQRSVLRSRRAFQSPEGDPDGLGRRRLQADPPPGESSSGNGHQARARATGADGAPSRGGFEGARRAALRARAAR